MPTRQPNPPSTPLQLATIGYEGRTPDEFAALLARNSIEVLVDVRQRAGSRNRGFAKSALQTLAAVAGIEYQHFPMLGTPASLRQRFKAGKLDLKRYLLEYRKHLKGQNESLVALEKLIADKRCCLLCVEADPQTCHRSVLAQVVSEASGAQIEVKHL